MSLVLLSVRSCVCVRVCVFVWMCFSVKRCVRVSLGVLANRVSLSYNVDQELPLAHLYLFLLVAQLVSPVRLVECPASSFSGEAPRRRLRPRGTGGVRRGPAAAPSWWASWSGDAECESRAGPRGGGVRGVGEAATLRGGLTTTTVGPSVFPSSSCFASVRRIDRPTALTVNSPASPSLLHPTLKYAVRARRVSCGVRGRGREGSCRWCERSVSREGEGEAREGGRGRGGVTRRVEVVHRRSGRSKGRGERSRL